MDVQWDDVRPALEAMPNVELQEGLENAEELLSKLALAAGPAAMKFLIARLRPKIEPVMDAITCAGQGPLA